MVEYQNPQLDRLRRLLGTTEPTKEIEETGGLIYEKPDIETRLRMARVENPQLSFVEKALRMFQSVGTGFTSEATLGATERLPWMKPPPRQGDWEETGEQVGRFIGFIVGGPAKLMKFAGKGLKAGAKILPKAIKGAKAAKLAGTVGKGATELGVGIWSTEALAPEKEQTATQRLASGGKIGTVFGLTSMIAGKKFPALTFIARQVGSRGLAAAAGEYQAEGWSPQRAYQELLFTYFSSRGKSVRDILKEPQEKTRFERVNREIRQIADEFGQPLNPIDVKEFIEFAELHSEAGIPLEYTIVKQRTPQSKPVYKYELDILQDQVDIPTRRFKYYIENPIRIFEEFPIFKHSVYNEMKRAEHRYTIERQDIQRQVKQLKKSIKGQSQEEIGKYAIAQQPYGESTLRIMDKTDIKMTDPMYDAYGEVRRVFDMTHERLNQARATAGAPPIPKIENYFTFMRNASVLEELGHNLVMERDLGVFKNIQRPEWIHPRMTGMPYARPRKPMAKPVELKFFDVFESYMDTALKHIHKGPVIAKGRDLLGDFGGWSLRNQAPILHDYSLRWLDFNSGKRPPSNMPDWINNMAFKLSRNVGISVLSYNVRTALVQATALRNSYLELGERYLMEGIADSLFKGKRQFAMENANVLKGRMFDVHMADIVKQIHRAPPKTKIGALFRKGIAEPWGRLRDPLARGGIWPMKVVDLYAAEATWLGAYRKGMAPKSKGGLGLFPRDAKIYADDVVTRTQASAAPSDVAQMQRTPMGKLATVFQTFVINEWNFLAKEVFGYKNPNITTAERMENVGRLVLSTAIINAIFERGLGFRSPFPAPEWAIYEAIQKGGDTSDIIKRGLREALEQLPVVGGAIRWSQPWKVAWPASMEIVADIIQRTPEVISDPSQIDKEDLDTVGRIIGVPGTAQIIKYIRRRKRGMNHAEAIIGLQPRGEF